jgi:hypothetical protein
MGSPSTDINKYADLPKVEECGNNAEPIVPLDTTAAEIAEETASVIKVSELMRILNGVLSSHGDLTVAINVFHDTEEAGGSYSIDPIVGVYFEVDDNKVAQKLVLCDADHLNFANENNELTAEEIKPQGSN